MDKKNIKLGSHFLLLAIFIFRYLFDTQIAEFYAYATYFIELGMVFLALISFDSIPKFKFKIKSIHLLWFFGAILSGFFIFKLAGFWKVIIPFNLTTPETVFFLLIVAPVLEEFLFRFTYIAPFENRGFNSYNLATISATLFSLSHFNAIRYVPPEFYSFVYFQSGYTFFLGLACYLGKLRFNTSIIFPVFLHFLFNLGFYLSSIWG